MKPAFTTSRRDQYHAFARLIVLRQPGAMSGSRRKLNPTDNHVSGVRPALLVGLPQPPRKRSLRPRSPAALAGRAAVPGLQY